LACLTNPISQTSLNIFHIWIPLTNKICLMWQILHGFP
jgi:hypothetical protein